MADIYQFGVRRPGEDNALHRPHIIVVGSEISEQGDNHGFGSRFLVSSFWFPFLIIAGLDS
jgi:hypothetical protein